MNYNTDSLALTPNATMDEDLTSETYDIRYQFGFHINAVWTGTPTGNVVLQGSQDGTVWFDVDTQAAGGAAGSKQWNYPEVVYGYVRVFYDYTSSTGSLTVTASKKGV